MKSTNTRLRAVRRIREVAVDRAAADHNTQNARVREAKRLHESRVTASEITLDELRLRRTAGESIDPCLQMCSGHWAAGQHAEVVEAAADLATSQASAERERVRLEKALMARTAMTRVEARRMRSLALAADRRTQKQMDEWAAIRASRDREN